MCYSLIWTSTVDSRTHRPTSRPKQQQTFANIRLWKHCFPCFPQLFKYGSESSTGAKVKGHESSLWSERSTGVTVPWNESSLNIRSSGAKVSSRGTKVPWNKSSWTFHSSGANVPRNESSTGAKVLSIDFSLPGTKVQRNEKARYPGVARLIISRLQLRSLLMHQQRLSLM